MTISGIPKFISIHALLAESDGQDLINGIRLVISIHALLAESDRQNPGEHYVAFRFLSTLSLRRATAAPAAQMQILGGFLSTLSLRRATQTKALKVTAHSISIHALLAESDDHTKTITPLNQDFYPRSPCGERLRQSRSSRGLRDFYPRSPCGERRFPKVIRLYNNSHFYPRSPCGERLCANNHVRIREHFYPRSPCGERPPESRRTLCRF